MAYIGNGPGVASQRILTTLTATEGQTSFTPSAGYTLGYVDVFLNGVKLIDGTDYAAADGVSIVLTEAATLDDTVEVVAYFPRGLSDGYTKAEADGRYEPLDSAYTKAEADSRYEPLDSAYTKAEADARYVEVSGDTMTGNLTVPMVVTSSALSNRNHVINGSFDVWQRGVSSGALTTGSTFVADRWATDVNAHTVTVTREEFPLGQTDVPNAKYFHRHDISVASTNYVHFDNRIEDVRRFDNQVVTLTFWARASAPHTLGLEFVSNYDGSPEDNGSANPAYNQGDMQLTTTWQKFTKTVTTTSLAGKSIGSASKFTIRFVPSSGASFQSRWGGALFTGTVDIAQVQLEYGDTATPFEHRSYGDELQRCQRYYQKFWHDSSANGFALSMIGAYWNATEHYCSLPLTTTMRARPSLSYSDLQALRVFGGGASNSSSNIGIDAVGSTSLELNVSSSNTASSAFVRINNSDDWVALDAEL